MNEGLAQYVLNLLIGTYAAVLTCVAIVLWNKINSVEKAHNELRVQVASSYHTKDEFRQLLADAMRPVTDYLQNLSRGVEELRALVLHNGAPPGGSR